MAETLELQQVICPSCKRSITSFSPFQAQVECPYCHNKAFNPLITAKKVPIPERIIVFRTAEGDFEKAMINNLVERDYVPTNIFEAISPDNVIKAYLPMFLYEGTYHSSWTCKVAVETNELQASSDGTKVQNKKVKKFLPHTGTSQGNFAFLCLAYEGKDIPEELREFSSQFPYNVMASKEYDPELLVRPGEDSPMTMAMDTDADITWNKYGNSLVDGIARQNAMEQLDGDEIKDFRSSNSFDLKHGGRYVLAPFWFVYYTYNNERHYFIMDGLGENTAMSTPIDQDELAYVKSKEKVIDIVKWSGLLTIVMIFIGGFTAAVITAIVWFIANLIVKKVMNNQIKNKLEDSRELRRAAAANLQ